MNMSNNSSRMRTTSLTDERIGELMSEYSEHLGGLRFSDFRGCDKFPSFLTVELPTFGLFDQNVGADIHGMGDDETLFQLADLLNNDGVAASASWVTSSVTVVAGGLPQDVSCGLSLHETKSKTERAEYFTRALRFMHLSESVTVSLQDDTLLMHAAEPYTLTFPTAEIDGKNPHGFWVSGPEKFCDVIQTGRALVESLNIQPTKMQLNSGLNPIQYERHRAALNAISHWQVGVIGYLNGKAKNALSGNREPLDDSPFIPAFSWWKAAYGPEGFGALVLRDGEQFFDFPWVTTTKTC